MAGPRPLVAPPSFVPGRYGLLSVVQPRYDEPDSHWRNGVTYQGTCGLGGTTFDDYCVTGVGAPTKTENIDVSTRGATPFTVTAKIDCSPVGYDQQEPIDRVLQALTHVEQYQVEKAFWTGTVAGGSGGYVAYPHLAANAAVYDSPGSLVAVLLQPAATQVTGVSLDPAEALGRLEFALGNCLGGGEGVVHMTAAVFEIMTSRGLTKVDGQRMRTSRGTLIVIGDGYTGSGPDGTTPTGAHWMYGTGPIFAYRTSQEMVGQTYREIFDRETNTVEALAERTYVLGFDCCLSAVLVSLGGEISGSFNAAT